MIKGAVSPVEIAELNAQVDKLNPATGNAMGITAAEAKDMMRDPHNPAGKDVQQGFGTAAGGVGLGSHPCFDALIDHPGYIEHIKDFTDGEGTRLKSRFGVMERWPGQASGRHKSGSNWAQVDLNFVFYIAFYAAVLFDCRGTPH